MKDLIRNLKDLLWDRGFNAGARKERKEIIALLQSLETDKWLGINLELASLIKKCR